VLAEIVFFIVVFCILCFSLTIIPKHQFGFRKSYSTIQQAHRIINEIIRSQELKKICTVAFLDVAQAFDRVWHLGLLYKLKKVLPTDYYLILKSYLSHRYFQTKVNFEISSYHPIQAGVPQGSVLGPILYLIFTADIPTTHNPLFIFLLIFCEDCLRI
jgi:retron-type reverse transcriptase